MKNIFGIAFFLLFTITASQAQYRTFPKGKAGGDIIGKGDIRFEVVKSGSTASFYPINAEGAALKKLPATIEIDVLYLGMQSSEIMHPELQQGRYTVNIESDRIIYYYFVKGDFNGKPVEMKEQMADFGK